MSGVYIPEWDLPHQPGEEETWQESDCYWFYDPVVKVGGWQRVGQFVNRGDGQSSVFLYEKGGERYLDRQINISSAEMSRSERGQTVGKSEVICESPQVMSYKYLADEAELDLKFDESYFEPRSWKKSGGPQRGDNAGHLECSGRVRGTVRIGNKKFELNALAHRDRSWGPRNLKAMNLTWFATGTAGPELSWNSMIAQFADGYMLKVGFIARGRETTDIKDIAINTLMADDGLTPLRSQVKLIAEDDELLLDIHTNQGFVQRLSPGPFMVIDQSSTVYAEGKQGFCDFGVTVNTFRGEHLPTGKVLKTTCAEDGLSPAVDHSRLLMPAFQSNL